jgi:translation initiation factor IF-1
LQARYKPRLFCQNEIRCFSLNYTTTIYCAITTRFMPTEDSIVTEGKIVTVLPGTMFRVELSNQHQVLAHISGKMRKKFIRLTVGDRVKLEMSPYDLGKARIVYRLG